MLQLHMGCHRLLAVTSNIRECLDADSDFKEEAMLVGLVCVQILPFPRQLWLSEVVRVQIVCHETRTIR